MEGYHLVISVNTENIRHRSVIEFLTKEGKTSSEVHERTRAVYSETLTSYPTVKRWATIFKRGRDYLEGDPDQVAVWTGPLKKSSKIEEYVPKNQLVTIFEIAMKMGINVGSIE